jgi:O-antigen/teichoic acid export membrane protein
VSVIMGVGLVLAIELAAPTIVQVLAGDAAEPSVAVLRLQAPALAATSVAIACGYPLLSLRRHKALMLAGLVALVASVGLCLALIPIWGARGAAVATTVAEIGLATTNFLLLTRFGKGVRLSGGILWPVALAAAVGSAAIALPVPEVVRALVGATVYLGVLAAMGLIPRELLDAVSRRRARSA